MRRFRMLLVSSFAITAVLFGVVAAPASAATYNSTVTIHARVCPTGGPTHDIFTDCHPHAAWPGTAYKINNHGSKTINSSGNLTFSGLGSANRTITQTAGYEPNEFLKVRAYCSADGGAAVEVPVKSTSAEPRAHFSFFLKANSHVTCDVYFIPISGQ